MEDNLKTETTIKSKISFSVESLLSNKKNLTTDRNIDLSRSDNNNCDDVQERLIKNNNITDEDEDEDEDITVDDDDDEIESRESLSPNSGHNIIVPQPLHPSIPRMVTTQGPPPQWPFPWPGHAALLRSSSPQSKFHSNCLLRKLRLITIIPEVENCISQLQK